MFISTTVISGPDDVTVCEGASPIIFICVLDSNISKDDAQWYILLPNTSISNAQGDNMIVVPITDENSFTTRLFIFDATKSHTGYYWVRLPSDDVCNVSLTVLTSM